MFYPEHHEHNKLLCKQIEFHRWQTMTGEVIEVQDSEPEHLANTMNKFAREGRLVKTDEYIRELFDKESRRRLRSMMSDEWDWMDEPF